MEQVPKPQPRKFDKQFKLDAICMDGSGGKNAALVACGLGIYPEALSRWKRQLKDEGEGNAFPGKERGSEPEGSNQVP